MNLIVQKFGGSSLADAKKVFNVAGIITDTYKKGNDVIAVVSAQGDTTDELVEAAHKLNPRASKREMDMLLTAGEQISCSLLAMAIESLGYPVVSLLGWQAGFNTNSTYGNARIKKINNQRLKKEIDKHNIVIVAGFQGINNYNDITTFGRGGSDTSAVAIASAMHADKCQIYTDVGGVYTADPRICKNAKKLKVISYDEMLELASLGAQVLNNRSVEMAKKYNVELEVVSSMTRESGTIIKEANKMEKMLISGVAKDTNVAMISIKGIPNKEGIIFKIFSKLASKDMNVDIILQKENDITLIVKQDKLKEILKLLEVFFQNDKVSIVYDEHLAKISIVGAGMESHSEIASDMFEALYDAQIDIELISSSEIKISILIDENKVDDAMVAIHDKFF